MISSALRKNHSNCFATELLECFNQLEKFFPNSKMLYTEESFCMFQFLPVEKQAEIIKNLINYFNVLDESKLSKSITSKMSKNDEIECVQDALNQFNMSVWDDDLNFISEGDIVEIYNNKNIQVYRNFQLLKVNPYDLLTVLTHDWQALYDRATKITVKIGHKITEVMTSELTSAVPFSIPEHSMKAISKEDQVVVSIRLKYIKPVFNINKTKKIGFIATQLNSPVILEGGNVDSVSMLKSKGKSLS